MISGVCTLFEGDYHLGVGALANSLYAHGYRGTIYAGYRGSLPPWISAARDFGGFTEFTPADGLVLRFIRLATAIHLTNYKPDFLLSMWQDQCPQTEALFYFDPDITIKCRWSFFEDWVEAGVALCEDIYPDLGPNHPLRYAWRKNLASHGLNFHRQLNSYFNGGFIGFKIRDRGFLPLWQKVQMLMAPALGGLEQLSTLDRTAWYGKQDQDAMNITAMVCNEPLSPVGQDGMDFVKIGYIMSHAAGQLKPWRKKMLVSVLLKAIPPSQADKAFFRHATNPIRLYSRAMFALKLLDLKCASAIGRYVH
jgi:hypothetical protein